MSPGVFLRKIERAVVEHGLLKPGQIIVAAVSGGADSVAMLHALHFLSSRHRFQLVVAHLHHGLRGRAADGDQRFVGELAGRLGWPFRTDRVDVPARARRWGISLEMAAREARHDFLGGVMRAAGAHAVATAHTADDQVETVLLRLCRGAGLRGLRGMEARQRLPGLTIVRPMLEIAHAQAEQFLRQHGRAWREDASNRDPDFLRNRVRHEVLPLLEARLNPRVKEALLRTAALAREADDYLSDQTARALRVCAGKARGDRLPGSLAVPRLRALPLALRRRVALAWLMDAGLDEKLLSFAMVERIMALASTTTGSAEAPVGRGWRARRTYDVLSLDRGAAKAGYCCSLKIPGVTCIPAAGLVVSAAWGKGPGRRRRDGLGKWPASCSISRRRIGQQPLVMRSWQAGDRMAPFGMQGRRKLQDIFGDAKLPRHERTGWPVLECRGELVWLPGYRIAAGWAVDAESSPSLRIRIDLARK